VPYDPFALVGQTLEGQYRIDAVVGEGGCGVVYQGRHIAFEQPIAVKALKMPDVGDASARISVLTKFREEAKLCYVLSQASLSIVRCIAYGAVVTPTQAWAPYLVLEWLDGRPLSEELEDRRRRGLPAHSMAEAVELLAPVAAGLGYAHSRRVAHRDVKPANLFLVRGEPGASPMVKILDFGIAKVMAEGATAASAPWTKDGIASFTPYYAAPEQLDRRFGPSGPWTDVYAFALVMVEILAGRQPMQGANVMTILLRATDPAQRPTPRAFGVAVSDAVEAVFARALAIDPKARFHEMAPFWEALTAALKLGSSGKHPDPLAPAAWVSPPRTVPMPMPRPGEPAGAGSTLPLQNPAGARAPSAPGKPPVAAATLAMTAESSWGGPTPGALGSWHGRPVPGVLPAAGTEVSRAIGTPPPMAATLVSRPRRWPLVLAIMALVVVGAAVTIAALAALR
jgi:serine/threonine protein kinase